MNRKALIYFIFSIFIGQTLAVEYSLGDKSGDIFGKVEHIRVHYEDTLIEIARKYSLGYEELIRVNKGVDPWLPGEGTEVLIPGMRLLTLGEREGIIVNLPEHRLYFFPKKVEGQPPKVFTFPVSVGKMDWQTPIGATRIIEKRKNPTWIPPESVRKEHAALGEPPLPAFIGPGSDNPLGAYALRLDIPGAYLIHGTNNPDAVGMAVTHGCLRMFPEDIERLFAMVTIGTRVNLINEPLKMVMHNGELWIEVHPPVDSQGQTTKAKLEDFEKRLEVMLDKLQFAINWDIALEALREASGIPALIGLELVPEILPVQEVGSISNQSDVVSTVNR